MGFRLRLGCAAPANCPVIAPAPSASAPAPSQEQCCDWVEIGCCLGRERMNRPRRAVRRFDEDGRRAVSGVWTYQKDAEGLRLRRCMAGVRPPARLSPRTGSGDEGDGCKRKPSQKPEQRISAVRKRRSGEGFRNAGPASSPARLNRPGVNYPSATATSTAAISNGRSAQGAAIPRRLGERAKSTRSTRSGWALWMGGNG